MLLWKAILLHLVVLRYHRCETVAHNITVGINLCVYSMHVSELEGHLHDRDHAGFNKHLNKMEVGGGEGILECAIY